MDPKDKVDNVKWEQLPASIKLKLEKAVDNLRNMNWEGVPETAKQYIQAHPYLTTFQISMLLFTFCPALFAGPMLGAMGFSSLGPVAGSGAAAFQSANGATAAFSTLQSAAMGGYGVAIVNGAVQGASFAATTVTIGLSWVFKKRDGDKPAGEDGPS